MSEIVTRITNYHRLLQSKQKVQATNIQEEEIGISVNFPCALKVLVENHDIYSDLIK